MSQTVLQHRIVTVETATFCEKCSDHMQDYVPVCENINSDDRCGKCGDYSRYCQCDPELEAHIKDCIVKSHDRMETVEFINHDCDANLIDAIGFCPVCGPIEPPF